MGVVIHTSPDGSVVTIEIMGHFDLSAYEDFRQVYTIARRTATQYVIDLRQTESMDSSGLGMLLQLRVYAGGDRAQVQIVHCRPEVKKVLTTANFHQLFSLD